MNFFTDFFAINKVVIRKSGESYVKNLLLIPIFGLYVAAYILVSIALGMSLGQLGSAGRFLASMLTWFISCYIISDYLTHLENSISGFKFKFNQIGKNYMNYFMPLLTATAVPRIVAFLFTTLTRIDVPFTLILLFYLIYATPEVVYQKGVDRLEMFAYGHRFLRENWLHWLLVNAVHGLVIVGCLVLVNTFIMLPFGRLIYSLPLIIKAAMYYFVYSLSIGVPLLFYLIYRGYIFKILSVSSRRKREYMRNIYGK